MYLNRGTIKERGVEQARVDMLIDEWKTLFPTLLGQKEAKRRTR